VHDVHRGRAGDRHRRRADRGLDGTFGWAPPGIFSARLVETRCCAYDEREHHPIRPSPGGSSACSRLSPPSLT
jgi:hypothetical protein